MSPASVRGDPRGEIFLSRGRIWGAKTRRGIPRCHPLAFGLVFLPPATARGGPTAHCQSL
jgi:hypothetical protein